MSPQNARVFIVEDSLSWQEAYRALIDSSSHTLVQLATNMADAEEALPKLAEMGIQVAIIDGNISKTGHNGLEGKYLIGKIKRLFPEIKTIGMSGEFALNADIDLGKLNANDLIKTITDL